jgi:serine/threonine-protein kinase
MEYADHTLAQRLLRRALTEDEAREMLLPTLDALTFLHGRNLLQGQLKPANILVVGEQLKLASDTIRRVSEGPMSTNSLTEYDAPEARHGSNSMAGDVWALGVTLFEALTRRPPSGLGEKAVLPSDFAPAFHDIATRCLSPNPQDRPSVSELAARVSGRSIETPPEVAAQAVEPAPPEAGTAESPLPEAGTAEPPLPQAGTAEPPLPEAPSPPVTPAVARPAQSLPRYPKPRALLTVILGTLAILALGWIGVRVFGIHRAAGPPPPPVQDPATSPSATPGGAAPGTTTMPPPGAGASTAKAGRSSTATSPSALHEEFPDVPWSARRTIRGHIKVWVRVIVDQDGSVFAAAADRTGPSSYFQHAAIDAAKKWTFPPVDTPSRRMMQVRFDFSRDGTTGRAVSSR